MRRQLRRLGLAHDDRAQRRDHRPGYYRWTQWIFLQIYNTWYDAEAVRPADRRAGAALADRRRLAEPTAGRGRCPTACALGRPERRLSGPRVLDAHRLAYCRGAGQLVPRAGHRAGQRGGHRRGAQRARQLPGLQAQPAPVDDAHHRLRRPAGRRPGPLDWPETIKLMQRNWIGRSEGRGSTSRRQPRARRDRGLHDPSGHAVRRDVHGARARAPARRPAGLRCLADGRPPTWTGGAATPRDSGRGLPARRPRARPTWSARPRAGTRPVS